MSAATALIARTWFVSLMAGVPPVVAANVVEVRTCHDSTAGAGPHGQAEVDRGTCEAERIRVQMPTNHVYRGQPVRFHVIHLHSRIYAGYTNKRHRRYGDAF
jgi:hypothetical protein